MVSEVVQTLDLVIGCDPLDDSLTGSAALLLSLPQLILSDSALYLLGYQTVPLPLNFAPEIPAREDCCLHFHRLAPWRVISAHQVFEVQDS